MEHDLVGIGATQAFARDLAATWRAGEVVLIDGPLGVGKTTLVRALLRALGWDGEVRSPTFNLIHVYEVQPPVAHCDLYRVESARGLGLEEYLDDHLVLIEWPDRFDLMPHERCWRLTLAFGAREDARRATLLRPLAEDSC